MNIAGYEWVIYGLSLLSVTLLGTLSAVTSTAALSEKKLLLVKKICLAVFILTSIYWIITFPYVSSFYGFPESKELPANISTEEQSDYILENHRRIESLERELKQTKDDLKAVSGRIELFLNLAMYGLIYFGAAKIFTFKSLKDN